MSKDNLREVLMEALGPSRSTPPVRKVVHITSSIDSVGKYFVLAACNDGTIWKLNGLYEGNPFWEPFPAPPRV